LLRSAGEGCGAEPYTGRGRHANGLAGQGIPSDRRLAGLWRTLLSAGLVGLLALLLPAA